MSETKLRTKSHKKAAIIVASAFGFIVLTCAALQIAVSVYNSRLVYIKPDRKQIDLSEILAKSVISDEEYQILYEQTGLTKLGIDRCLANGSDGIERIKDIQSSLFRDYSVEHDCFAPFLCADEINGVADFCYLENGDILITLSTHFSVFEMGHAGLVTDAKNNRVLQANSYFSKSSLGTVYDFTDRLNFMILSPTADSDIKNQVAAYSEDNLLGKKYAISAGVLSDKNKCERTQCAHIVWYAYNQFGIDLDANGGLVVTPKNIANSGQVEVVQVFGFDLEKLWY